MKKTIFTGLLALTLVFPLSSFAAPVDSSDFDALKAQLIALITQEIAVLQAQLVEMLSAQATTNATVSQIQSQVQSIANPASVAGASAPTVSASVTWTCNASKTEAYPVFTSFGGEQTFVARQGGGFRGGGNVWDTGKNAPTLTFSNLQTPVVYTVYVGKDDNSLYPIHTQGVDEPGTWTQVLQGTADQSICN